MLVGWTDANVAAKKSEIIKKERAKKMNDLIFQKYSDNVQWVWVHSEE